MITLAIALEAAKHDAEGWRSAGDEMRAANEAAAAIQLAPWAFPSSVAANLAGMYQADLQPKFISLMLGGAREFDAIADELDHVAYLIGNADEAVRHKADGFWDYQ